MSEILPESTDSLAAGSTTSWSRRLIWLSIYLRKETESVKKYTRNLSMIRKTGVDGN